VIVRASPTGALYGGCAIKTACLARRRGKCLLQQALQTDARCKFFSARGILRYLGRCTLGVGCSSIAPLACAKKNHRDISRAPRPLHRQFLHPHAAAGAIPAMDAPSGTPPTPPYSIPPTAAADAVLPAHAPNPSDDAAAGGNSATAHTLFMPPRANLHTSAAAVQVQPTAPVKRKTTASKCLAAAVGADKPTLKTARTTAKAAAAQCVQPPPQAPSAAWPHPPPSGAIRRRFPHAHGARRNAG
jgi:hypothetical protein